MRTTDNPARINTYPFLWPQEYFIEEMAARAFQLTLAENRDTISYGDVGELGRNAISKRNQMPALHIMHATCCASFLT